MNTHDFKIPFGYMEMQMISCDQMPGLSIMDHGQMVARYYKDLVNHLRNGADLENEWRLPDWINDPIILENLLPDDIMETYHIYHDCGKPRCIEWDEDGKRHFPNHAECSKETWLLAGGDP